MVRYIKTFENSCLEIEVLKKNKKWDVISNRRLCSFEDKPFSTGFSYIGFEEITFEKDGVHLILNIIPLRLTGEEIRKCIVPIQNDHIGSLQCSVARKLE